MGLSAKAQRKEFRKAIRRTEEEDWEALTKTPAGAAALRANQQRAEELFLKAATVDPSMAEPYFGLGALYQQQAKTQEAVAAYRKYITLSRQPADKGRAERRIAAIEEESKAPLKKGGEMKPAVLLTLALVCGSGAREARGEAPHLNSKIVDKRISIRKAVLFPAQVSFTRVGGKGYEGGLAAADRSACRRFVFHGFEGAFASRHRIVRQSAGAGHRRRHEICRGRSAGTR